jgi:hypothetical protein
MYLLLVYNQLMKLSVIVHPNSKRPRVEKDLLGTVQVYVAAPPLEGKANREAVEALAAYFQTGANRIILISGQKSKQKVFEINQ